MIVWATIHRDLHLLGAELGFVTVVTSTTVPILSLAAMVGSYLWRWSKSDFCVCFLGNKTKWRRRLLDIGDTILFLFKWFSKQNYFSFFFFLIFIFFFSFISKKVNWRINNYISTEYIDNCYISNMIENFILPQWWIVGSLISGKRSSEIKIFKWYLSSLLITTYVR